MWRNEQSKRAVELLLGSLDEDFLFRGDVGQSIGKVLSRFTNGHFWCKNAVKGVTDVVTEGNLHERGSDSEVIR